MSRLGVLRPAVLGIQQTPLSRARSLVCLGTIQTTLPASSAVFFLDNRHFSTSDATPLTLEMTMTGGQLTDTAAAVASNGTGNEPWAIVQGVQAVLETVHTTTGLPWWATLMLSGVTLRAAIFPFYVYQIQATQRLMQASADIRKLHSAYKYARTFTPGSDHKGHLDAILLGRQGIRAVMKKYNTRPIQTVMGGVAYIPIFVVMAYSTRDMVRSGNFAGLDSGGLSIWKNLMETDSTYVLPALAALSTYGNLEMSARTKSGWWMELLRAGQYGTVLALPFMATLPQGVFFYWLGSSWSSMAQSIAMNNYNFCKRIGLKPRITKVQSTAAKAAEMPGKSLPADATTVVKGSKQTWGYCKSE